MVKKKHMQFWHVAPHDNSTKIYLSGFLCRLLIKHLLHLQNLKNTFQLEVAQIQILLKFEYAIVYVPTPAWASKSGLKLETFYSNVDYYRKG